MNRRTLFLCPVGILAGCNLVQTMTPAQIVTDAQGVVAAMAADIPTLFQAFPKAFSATQQANILADIQAAKAGVAALLPNLPVAQGASTVSKIEGYLNGAVAVVLAVAPAVPGLAAFVPEMQAAQVILQSLEAFANQYLPTAAHKYGAMPMSVADARARLRIPTVP
jgi:hypothetical protein